MGVKATTSTNQLWPWATNHSSDSDDRQQDGESGLGYSGGCREAELLAASVVEPELCPSGHLMGAAVESFPLTQSASDVIRIVFRPRLLSNVSQSQSAMYENIILLQGPNALPSAALRAIDKEFGRELTDWTTLIQGSPRMIEYLRFTGDRGELSERWWMAALYFHAKHRAVRTLCRWRLL